VLKNLLFGKVLIDVLIARSYAFFYKSIETTILTNEEISNAKDRNCIFGEFLKLNLQKSFEENLKIILQF